MLTSKSNFDYLNIIIICDSKNHTCSRQLELYDMGATFFHNVPVKAIKCLASNKHFFIYRAGLEMEIPDKGRITSKVYLLGSVLDLLARSSFLEMIQLNGFCSCCYCMILGISCKSSDKDGHRGRVTVFPFNFESSNGLVRERTSQSMVADGLQFLQGESGGKPVSLLSQIHVFYL